MAKESAGLLMFRRHADVLEVLLAHPGGPFWKARHEGAWTIPKGGSDAGETHLDTAIREFKEETGFDSRGPYIPLGHIIQRSGKVVHAWAFEGDCDPSAFVSMETSAEWPPRSGRHIVVPEIDRVQFFSIADAAQVLNIAQVELLPRLRRALGE